MPAVAPELAPGAPSDLELMLGIQAEDPEALSLLYDRYNGILKTGPFKSNIPIINTLY